MSQYRLKDYIETLLFKSTLSLILLRLELLLFGF